MQLGRKRAPSRLGSPSHARLLGVGIARDARALGRGAANAEASSAAAVPASPAFPPPQTSRERLILYFTFSYFSSPAHKDGPRAVSHVRLLLHVAHSAYASPPGRQGTCERARGSPDFADVTGLSSATTDTAIACGHPNYRLPDRQEVPMVFLGQVK